MKLRKLVEKIKSILVSGAETEYAVKVCALEYAVASMQVCALLERAVATCKAGLKSDAIMFAQKNNILENIQLLNFAEKLLWKSYCKQNGLITAPEPLEDSVDVVKKLFDRNIEQTNSLFRDYRRAMRLKDFDLALQCIEAIAKINPEDSKVKEELARIKRGLTGRKIRRAIEIMNSTDIAENIEFLDICSFLSQNVSNSKNYPSLELIYNRRNEVSFRLLNSVREGAVEKLKELDEVAKASEILDILDAIFVEEPTMVLSEPDMVVVVEKMNLLTDSLLAKINEEKTRTAGLRIAKALAQPEGKSKLKRITQLKQLRADACGSLSPETSKLLDKKINSLRFSVLCRSALSLCVCAVIAGAVCYGGKYAYDIMGEKNAIKNLNSALNSISMTDDPFVMQKSLAEVEQNYKDYLQDPAIAPIYKQVKSQIDVNMLAINRLTKHLDNAEKLDVSKASSRECQEMLESLESVEVSVSTLPQATAQKIKMRLEKIKQSAKEKIEERQLANSAKIKQLLADYESLLAAYEGFSGNRAELDARLAIIVPDLRSLMEDTSALFRPHRIDVDKFNDISSRIGDAKTRFADFDDTRKNLLASKTLSEYLAMAKLMKSNPFLPVDFYKKLEKVMAQTKEIKVGQLVDFADISAIEYANNVGAFARSTNKPAPALLNVYKYALGSRSVYVLGEVKNRENVWAQGKEVMQRAEEFTSNGKINQKLYRLHHVFGKDPTGEILTNGSLSAESVVATEIQNIASKKNIFEAIETLYATNVNPVFKLMLELYLFDEMRLSPIHSGLLYSSNALAREKLVRKFAHGFAPHSWMFESDEFKNNIAQKLYGAKAEDYQIQARKNINALVLAQKYPLKMVGIEGDFAKSRILFADVNAPVWAVSKESGKFERLGEINKASIAPLSPIFVEVKSSSEILKSVDAQ